jgi:hypothetical protein
MAMRRVGLVIGRVERTRTMVNSDEWVEVQKQ